MKRFSEFTVLFTFFIILDSHAAFSQQQNEILIVIESPNYKVLSQVPQLKPFVYDDDYMFGEIEIQYLPMLAKYNANYKIVDNQGWSGEYYVVTQRPGIPAFEKPVAANIIY